MLGVLLLGALSALAWQQTRFSPEQPTDHLGRAYRILERYPLIDGHVDLPYAMRHLAREPLRVLDEVSSDGMTGHVSLPKLRAGRVGGCVYC